MTVTGETKPASGLYVLHCFDGHEIILIITRTGATFHVETDSDCAECLLAIERMTDSAPDPDPDDDPVSPWPIYVVSHLHTPMTHAYTKTLLREVP